MQRLHIKLFNRNSAINVVPKPLNQLKSEDFTNLNPKSIKLHFFSNNFNNKNFDSKIIQEIIANFNGMNIFICTSSDETSFKKMDDFVNNGLAVFKKEIISNTEANIQSAKWRGNKFSNILSSNVLDNYFAHKNDPWIRKEIIFHTTI